MEVAINLSEVAVALFGTTISNGIPALGIEDQLHGWAQRGDHVSSSQHAVTS